MQHYISLQVATKLIAKKSILECLLSQEKMDSEWFLVRYGACAALSAVRVSKNSSKGLDVEVMAIVVIVSLFLYLVLLTPSIKCNHDSAVFWACALKSTWFS